MHKKHKHAELIKAWADGAQIQCKQHDSDGSPWEDLSRPIWDECCEYRVKPAAPKWPETTMSASDLLQIYGDYDGSASRSMVEVANAALRHSVETGQLVTREQFLNVCNQSLDASSKSTTHFNKALADIARRDEQIETLRALNRTAANKLSELRADRADRDKAIAEAVAHAYQHAKYTIAGPDAVDLAAVVAGVAK